MLLLAVAARAHEGHEHAPQPGDIATFTVGPIELSDLAISNLGIESVEAEIIELSATVDLVAQVEPLPENIAQITPRFEGTVTEIYAKLGERVKRGQPLLRLLPRTVGNPEVILKSPLDGAVTTTRVTLGQAFAPDTVLIVVGDFSKVLARGTAYESQEILRLKIGDPASLTVDIYPGRRFSGAIQRSDVGLEAESKTFEVYALIENPDNLLRPNLLGALSVATSAAQPVLAVPRRAVLGDLGNLFVFVRDGRAFERRAVRTGLISGDRIEIIDGVLPGEQVVTRGNYQLQFASSAAKPKEVAADTATESAPPGFWNRSLWIGIGLGAAVAVALGLLLPRRRAA